MQRVRFSILSTLLLLLVLGAASVRAQDFSLSANPGSEMKYDASLKLYTSTLSAKPPGSDSIWYFVSCPDNVPFAPIVTMQLDGPPSFMLLWWFSNDSIVPFPINTPVDLQTQKYFATSFFVGWNARPHIDTAFLTISDQTDTVVVRIIATPVGLWLAPDPAPGSVFDSIAVGETACRGYKIHNYTGYKAGLSGLDLEGVFSTGGPWQAGTHCSISNGPILPRMIANQDSLSFSVCYNPTVVATENDTLYVFVDDTVLTDRFTASSITPLSVESTLQENPVKVFPNPSASRLYISGISDGESFTIIDALGREVVRDVLRSGAIDIMGCSAGVYTIVFNSGERASFIKL